MEAEPVSLCPWAHSVRSLAAKFQERARGLRWARDKWLAGFIFVLPQW
jgi:hypothetical protein